jgi:hypothetical protein
VESGSQPPPTHGDGSGGSGGDDAAGGGGSVGPDGSYSITDGGGKDHIGRVGTFHNVILQSKHHLTTASMGPCNTQVTAGSDNTRE